MNKYNDIEILTAKNLLKKGLKWIVRDVTNHGTGVLAFEEKPQKLSCWWSRKRSIIICDGLVPIFENVKFGDTEPTSLESIVNPQILDDAEKRYLSAVIRPFRNRVQYIEKVCADHLYSEPDYYISIRFNDGNYDMNFPYFDESHMYKCMEIDRAYTLEELGL